MLRCQTLPPCQIEPVPDSSKMDPRLTKAEQMSDTGNISVITCLRRKKLLHNSIWERGATICEGISSADTIVHEKGVAGGAPGSGAEIAL